MMRTRSQDVTETIRGWILDGTLPAGERLEEIPLSERLGVSRTPVRAALTLLATERLVDYQPKRGYVVRLFEPDDVFAAYEVRATIEGLACRLAAWRGIPDEAAAELRGLLDLGDRMLAGGRLIPDDLQPYQAMNVRLHDTIITLSGNHWVGRFVDQTHAIPFVSDRVILWHDYGVISRSHDDHHRIVDAVIARQAARAEDLMREHVYFAGQFLKANFHLIGPHRKVPDHMMATTGRSPGRTRKP
jgi:GntR family transcriptional regulator of vanillate catabolism